MKYRKKPIVVEAFQLGDGNKWPEWANVLRINCRPPFPLPIQTLEGTMYANKGDYIIRGVKGEIYPCKPDIFEATYEPVEA